MIDDDDLLVERRVAEQWQWEKRHSKQSRKNAVDEIVSAADDYTRHHRTKLLRRAIYRALHRHMK